MEGVDPSIFYQCIQHGRNIMIKWLLRRFLLLLFVLWGITTIVFIVLNVFPRNPALAMAGSWATQEQIEKFERDWGLDRPVIERYFSFYIKLLQGDLGKSIRTERPVKDEILHYFPATFELATMGIIISILFGVPLGILAAIKRNKLSDQVTRFISLIGVSVPNFWLGSMLLILFYAVLGFVGPGRVSSQSFAPKDITGLYILDSLLTGNWRALGDSIKQILLPAISLGFFGVGIISRMMRSSMLEVIDKDYILSARSKGLSFFKAIMRHGVKNAFAQVLTVIGVLYGIYLGGAIVIEVVFAWPGLGYFAYRSILRADQPAILGCVLIIALLYSVVNLLVDILYRVIDPRITF